MENNTVQEKDQDRLRQRAQKIQQKTIKCEK